MSENQSNDGDLNNKGNFFKFIINNVLEIIIVHTSVTIISLGLFSLIQLYERPAEYVGCDISECSGNGLCVENVTECICKDGYSGESSGMRCVESGYDQGYAILIEIFFLCGSAHIYIGRPIIGWCMFVMLGPVSVIAIIIITIYLSKYPLSNNMLKIYDIIATIWFIILNTSHCIILYLLSVNAILDGDGKTLISML